VRIPALSSTMTSVIVPLSRTIDASLRFRR
jgi:hypothetical protein